MVLNEDLFTRVVERMRYRGVAEDEMINGLFCVCGKFAQEKQCIEYDVPCYMIHCQCALGTVGMWYELHVDCKRFWNEHV